MQPDKVFISAHARDFHRLSQWWTQLLGRRWDREPMPNCHEWDLTRNVLFQVLDGGDRAPAVVTMHVLDIDAEIARLAALGFQIPDPVAVEGFATLRYCRFEDIEGNEVGLLDGE